MRMIELAEKYLRKNWRLRLPLRKHQRLAHITGSLQQLLRTQNASICSANA